jgi:hypothetical protein
VYTARTRRRRPSQIRTRLGFIQPHLSVVNLESNHETQPSHTKGWEGDPKTPLDTFHLHPSARILESSPTSARSNLCHRCKHLCCNTITIKSDKQDVGLYPSGGQTWVNSCVPSSLSDRHRVRRIPYSHYESKALKHGHFRG